MSKKVKKLISVLAVPVVLIGVGLFLAFGHGLFKTLPFSLAVSSHTDKAPVMVAHRGLSSLYPQNSIPAFEAAAKSGFDGYELDIHTTKDGKWVVIHDNTVDDMTDGTGEVNSFTYEEIRKLRLDNGNGIENHKNLTIPSLEESLDIFKEYGIIPVIEIKGCDVQYLPSLKETLDSYGLSDKAIIISFTKEYLEVYRALDKEIEIMLLKSNPDKEDVDWCTEYSAGLDSAYHDLYKYAKILPYAKEKGVKLGAWTVDSTAHLDVMVLFGFEVITTNKILP